MTWQASSLHRGHENREHFLVGHTIALRNRSYNSYKYNQHLSITQSKHLPSEKMVNYFSQ